MHATTGAWMTHHGLRKLQRERADLRDWLSHIKLNVQKAVNDHRTNKEIELILFEKQVVSNRLKRVDNVLHNARMLPEAWCHKVEARAGDTVYLHHGDTVRALTLAPVWNADPVNGRVSVVSPLGRALIGRHPGNKVCLGTLDGDVNYEIIKII